MAHASSPRPPLDYPDVREWVRKIALSVTALLDGKADSHGSVTLTANAATTTLTDARIGGNSVVHLSQTTANAAAEIGNGTVYIGTYVDGSCTITHANNAQTDRTFRYSIVGG